MGMNRNPVVMGFRKLGHSYATISTNYPHSVAAATAFFVLGGADMMAQFLECKFGGRKSGWDRRRTLSLVCFGVFYYGGPCKFFYMRYPGWMELLIPKAPNPVKKMTSAMIDCGIVTPILLLPTFYLITFKVKGHTFAEAYARYMDDAVEATVGTFLFWFPICSINFAFVPIHSQILVITICSFIHKTWLSWVSNRYTNKQQSDWSYTGFIKSKWKNLKAKTHPAPPAKMTLLGGELTGP